MASSSALGKRGGGGGESGGMLAAISRSAVVRRGSTVVSQGAAVANKLMRSTGKAVWITMTTFLVLGVPLIIEMDREQQLTDMELHQQALLGGK